MLAREVGEGVSVSSLLGTNTNWKGRAQQIIVLQNKVYASYNEILICSLVFDNYLISGNGIKTTVETICWIINKYCKVASE